jgi:hypothetical protein
MLLLGNLAATLFSTILLVYSTLLGLSLDLSRTDTQPPRDSTEVIVIGTIHGDHSANVHYSAETLRDIIVALQPAAILIELPPRINGRPTVVNGRRASWLSRANEGWAQNAAAEALKVPLIPFDRDGRNEFYAQTRYFSRRDSASARLEALVDRLRVEDSGALEPLLLEIYHDISRSQRLLHRAAPPEVINSAAFDELIRAKRSMDQDLVLHLAEAHADQSELVGEYRFFGAEWEERNRIMAENIEKVDREYPGKRLVVLTGSEHRYVLREHLMGSAGLVVREYWELLQPRSG